MFGLVALRAVLILLLSFAVPGFETCKLLALRAIDSSLSFRFMPH